MRPVPKTLQPARSFSLRRFSLRALFALIAVCAMLLGLWTAYLEPFRQQRHAIDALVNMGVRVDTSPAGPGWLRA